MDVLCIGRLRLTSVVGAKASQFQKLAASRRVNSCLAYGGRPQCYPLDNIVKQAVQYAYIDIYIYIYLCIYIYMYIYMYKYAPI